MVTKKRGMHKMHEAHTWIRITFTLTSGQGGMLYHTLWFGFGNKFPDYFQCIVEGDYILALVHVLQSYRIAFNTLAICSVCV